MTKAIYKRRNKVGRIGYINSEHEVPLRPYRVEGRGDAIVIDVDRSFDLSAAIRAWAGQSTYIGKLRAFTYRHSKRSSRTCMRANKLYIYKYI